MLDFWSHSSGNIKSWGRGLNGYGKAYSGKNPELIEGDIFRIIVRFNSKAQSGAQSNVILNVLLASSCSANELFAVLGLQSKTGAF